jgi:hypothetical protein
MKENVERNHCPELSINGVECIGWSHPQDFPFNSYENTEEVAETLRTGGPSAVTVDGLALSIYEDMVYYKLRHDPLLDGAFADNGNVLVVGDFVSNYALSERSKKDFRKTVVLGASVIGSSAFVARGRRGGGERKMTRRDFLKFAAETAAGSLILYGVFKTTMGLAKETQSKLISSCDLENPIKSVYEAFDDPYDVDVVYRTGLVLAKQANMRDAGFLEDSKVVVENNKSVWGLDHLMSQAISISRQIAADPTPHVNYLVDRELAFYAERGLAMSEAIDRVARLKTDIAGAIPVSVRKKGDVLHFDPVGQKKQIFFDDKLLGYDSSGMSFDKIMQLNREICLDRYLAMETNYV